MGITTDKIMEGLAREISCKIIARSAGGIYTLQHKIRPGPTFKMFFDEQTGILTSSCMQEVMSEKFNRIAQDMIDELAYIV